MEKLNSLSLIFVIATLLFASCKNKTENTTDISDYISNDLPSDFLDFYQKFHSDSLYQIAHILFPLKEKQDQSLWQLSDWKMHKPFDDLGGQYQRKFTNLNGIIIENIFDVKGMFQMERRYIKDTEGYNLIYYNFSNAFDNSEDWEPG